ncbi:MAG TPA: helix-turn-helix transcriptional regulator, partial [Actinocrinis sp.]|nr:helix-turn-helix transcriptional regulator [Actinocrinis sp.]
MKFGENQRPFAHDADVDASVTLRRRHLNSSSEMPGAYVAMEPGLPLRSVPSAEPPDALIRAAAHATTLEDLAGLLRDLRRRHARGRRDSSLTYRELAAKTGWSTTSIAQYFTAHTLPPTDRFEALLEVLGTTPAERRALANARDRVEETQYRTRNRRPTRQTTTTDTPAPATPRPTPPTPATPVVPRQLPAAPRLFTGRTTELARLTAALDTQPTPTRTLVISAIGG